MDGDDVGGGIGALPGAGWFADPEHPGQLRWWDGSTWTEHRQPIPAGVGSVGTAAHGLPAGVELASPWVRLGAAFLDQFIVLGAFVVVAILGVGLNGLGTVGELLGGAILLAGILFAFANAFLHPAKYGRTLAKHLLGIEIQRLPDGDPELGWGLALGREIVKGLGSYVFLLGLLWILFDERNQGWHDKAGRTLVVRVPGPREGALDFLARTFSGRRSAARGV